jgi:hypothetical protein
MHQPVTYQLSPPGEANCFYKDLYNFTNELWVIANFHLAEYVDEYCDYIVANNIEQPRSKDEYLLELVITGVLVKNYYAKAQQTHTASALLLDKLYAFRKNHQRLKPAIDKLRGVLGYVLLNKKGKEMYNFSLNGFANLLQWLSATGEFNEEVLRLKQWAWFYKIKTAKEVRSILNTAVVFTNSFEAKGEERLGKYVCNVNRFLKNKVSTYRFREDYFFVSRCRNEYFMNMFGAEILNRHMRNHFLQMRYKAVLLPTCMRTPPAKGCGAIHDGKELVCMQCSRDCNVGRVATAMKKRKVKSYLIPHSSGFSIFLRKWENSTDTALIGVTCILNLLAGGYEMKRLNIAAQCIFLDYCACKKHWDKNGAATTLNVEQLMSIVG